jgi:ATP diphosphatase
MRSAKLSKRAAREAGFDWDRASEVWDKIAEEIAELKQAEALAPHTSERAVELKSEVGDLLFAVSNLARHLDVDPEEALQAANARFISRFQWMEKNGGGTLASLSKEEKESLWQKAKKALHAASS